MVELLAVIAVIGILAALLLPALNQARGHAQAIGCLNNTKQLTLAWHVYAGDNGDRLPYNLELANPASAPRHTDLNWVNNILSWTLNSDNTNAEAITKASLGIYVGNPNVYHCPADNVLSAEQKNAGWPARNRSYSMNMMVGEIGDVMTNGVNLNNPSFTQFYKSAQVPRPAEIFVFLDEHPDTINDGYFKMVAPQNLASAQVSAAATGTTAAQWIDLPASYHNRAAAFSYADGHCSLHRWQQLETYRPAQPNAANPRPNLPPLTDYNWVLSHMSVYSSHGNKVTDD